MHEITRRAMLKAGAAVLSAAGVEGGDPEAFIPPAWRAMYRGIRPEHEDSGFRIQGTQSTPPASEPESSMLNPKS